MWYLFQRTLQMLGILVVLSAALFGLLSAMPGNPIDMLVTSNPNIKPEDVIRLKKLRGLDRPWHIQYFRWLYGYPEPARPPVIASIEKIEWENENQVFDLKPYLVDPNFVPDQKLLKKLLSETWPDWESSSSATKLELALKNNDISELLLLVGKKNLAWQNQMVAKLEAKSSDELEVRGLFGAEVKDKKLQLDPKLGGLIYFVVKNSYGQEKLGHVFVSGVDKETTALVKNIDTKVVEDESKPFGLDLNQFALDKTKLLSFKLLEDDSGTIDENNWYSRKFDGPGQSVISVLASDSKGVQQQFAFDVEHGVVGHENKFNRGFLYFFTGDKNALGFSQTYKRPVYELLFGSPAICGDGRVDAGETCDDGNLIDADGCDANCFVTNEAFMSKADASLSGYLVSSGRIGNTIQLMLPALLLSLLIAIPLGVFSAYRQYSVLDYIVNFFAFIGISLPVFWFGIMMIYVFAEAWQLFPAGGVQTPGIYGQGIGYIFSDRIIHAILPTMVLSIFYVGRWLRYMRASMLEVLPKDYVRTARAKGLSEAAVILKHAFRNALIPVVTVLALSIPSLFGGAVLTETVFSWPGVGRLQYDAVMNSDYYVAIVVFLVSAFLVMMGNLLADAVYVLVDPRIRKK